jgi:hypothetical protein
MKLGIGINYRKFLPLVVVLPYVNNVPNMKRFLLERFASMTFHFEEVLEHQLSTLIS